MPLTWTPDAPAMGIYRADTAKAYGEVEAIVRERGESEESFAKWRASTSGDLWLVFDPDLEVILFHNMTEDGGNPDIEGRQISFARGLGGFKLGEKPDPAYAKCKAESAEAISCKLTVGSGQGERPFPVEFSRESAQPAGLPFPGVYRGQGAAPLSSDAVKYMEANTPTAAAAKHAIELMETSPAYFFFTGDLLVLWAPSLEDGRVAYGLDRSEGRFVPKSDDSFEMIWAFQGVESSTPCRIIKGGFTCTKNGRQTDFVLQN